jgi:hypothetical protein
MAYNVLSGSVGASSITASIIYGTFVGDGSSLVKTPGITTVATAADNRLITFTSTGGTAVAGEPNLTFNGAVLTVTGQLTASVGVSASAFFGNGAGLTGVPTGGSSAGIFTEINGSTAYTTSSVSIGGTDPPTYTLDVLGNAGFNEYLYHNGDTDTFIRFEPDKINIEAGAENMIYMVSGSGGDQNAKVTINNDGLDVDFQVKGLTEPDLIRVDALIDRVGIGERNPAASLHVSGNYSTAAAYLSGGVRLRRSVVSAHYTASAGDYFLGVNSSGGAISISLNATQFADGQTLVIKDETGNASTYSITLTAAIAQKIDVNQRSVIIESPFGAVNLYTDSTNWFIY